MAVLRLAGILTLTVTVLRRMTLSGWGRILLAGLRGVSMTGLRGLTVATVRRMTVLWLLRRITMLRGMTVSRGVSGALTVLTVTVLRTTRMSRGPVLHLLACMVLRRRRVPRLTAIPMPMSGGRLGLGRNRDRPRARERRRLLLVGSAAVLRLLLRPPVHVLCLLLRVFHASDLLWSRDASATRLNVEPVA